MLEKTIPEDVKLDMASLQLRQVHLEMEEHGISLNGVATGYIAVEFRCHHDPVSVADRIHDVI